jgi:hypothetical protein
LDSEKSQLSKEKDIDDWQINHDIFNFLNKVAGPFSIDCFASNLSKKVSRFYAKFCCVGVLGVDAFAFSWENETCWLVPPPKLIIKPVSHCKLSHAVGVMIIPKWKSALFWPFIATEDGWAQGISLLYEYENPCNFFLRGPFGNSVFTEGKFAGNVLVLKLDFKR